MTDTTELLTLQEVARRLRVSVDTVRRMHRRGDLPIVKLGEGWSAPARVRKVDLDAYLEEHMRDGVSPA